MSPRTRLLVFAVLIGIILVLVLGFAGINLPYLSRYLIFVVAIALYFIIVATLERYSRKKRVDSEMSFLELLVAVAFVVFPEPSNDTFLCWGMPFMFKPRFYCPNR